MKKLIILIALTVFALPLFAFIVKSDELTTRYGITYQERQNNNYIVKGDYSFSYLGNGTWDVKKLSSSSSNNPKDYNDSNTNYVLFIIIASVCPYYYYYLHI